MLKRPTEYTRSLILHGFILLFIILLQVNYSNSHQPIRSEYRLNNSHQPIRSKYRLNNSHQPIRSEYRLNNSHQPIRSKHRVKRQASSSPVQSGQIYRFPIMVLSCPDLDQSKIIESVMKEICGAITSCPYFSSSATPCRLLQEPYYKGGFTITITHSVEAGKDAKDCDQACMQMQGLLQAEIVENVKIAAAMEVLSHTADTLYNKDSTKLYGTNISQFCPPGTGYSGKPKPHCSDCAKGQYSLGGLITENVTCIPCAKDSYQEKTGQGFCPTCPVGTYTSGSGTTIASKCRTQTELQMDDMLAKTKEARAKQREEQLKEQAMVGVMPAYNELAALQEMIPTTTPKIQGLVVNFVLKYVDMIAPYVGGRRNVFIIFACLVAALLLSCMTCIYALPKKTDQERKEMWGCASIVYYMKDFLEFIMPVIRKGGKLSFRAMRKIRKLKLKELKKKQARLKGIDPLAPPTPAPTAPPTDPQSQGWPPGWGYPPGYPGYGGFPPGPQFRFPPTWPRPPFDLPPGSSLRPPIDFRPGGPFNLPPGPPFGLPIPPFGLAPRLPFVFPPVPPFGLLPRPPFGFPLRPPFGFPPRFFPRPPPFGYRPRYFVHLPRRPFFGIPPRGPMSLRGPFPMRLSPRWLTGSSQGSNIILPLKSSELLPPTTSESSPQGSQTSLQQEQPSLPDLPIVLPQKYPMDLPYRPYMGYPLRPMGATRAFSPLQSPQTPQSLSMGSPEAAQSDLSVESDLPTGSASSPVLIPTQNIDFSQGHPTSLPESAMTPSSSESLVTESSNTIPTTPMSMPESEPMDMPIRQPMGMPFRGPMGMPFRGPMGMPFRGPMAMPFRGPMGMPFRGPMAMPFRGPMGMPFRGPMGMPFRGPMGIPIRPSMVMPFRQPMGMPAPLPHPMSPSDDQVRTMLNSPDMNVTSSESQLSSVDNKVNNNRNQDDISDDLYTNNSPSLFWNSSLSNQSTEGSQYSEGFLNTSPNENNNYYDQDNYYQNSITENSSEIKYYDKSSSIENSSESESQSFDQEFVYNTWMYPEMDIINYDTGTTVKSIDNYDEEEWDQIIFRQRWSTSNLNTSSLSESS